jgi:hypothetical protein
MSLLFRIVYAAHAKGTHHKLALDALRHLDGPDSEAWTRVFLKHADLYLQGAKAPDDEFKDFKNHVLHPRDGYWGGAPEKAESWYGHLVGALRQSNWSEAVWCAGVLSHYVTDPVHPFHTAQSEAENSIHRAAEWSINRSYDALRSEAIVAKMPAAPAATQGPHWLKELVCAGADRANRDYEKLIAHYDFTRGVVEPTEGFDSIGRAAVSALLIHAASSFARVLDRAIAEAGVAPPNVSLSLETVIATLGIPLKLLQKRLADAADRRIVEAMYDELMRTGRVETTLPEDDRVIRDLHASEVLAPRAAATTALRAARLPVHPEQERLSHQRVALSTVVPVAPAAPTRGGGSVAVVPVSSAAVAGEHKDARGFTRDSIPAMPSRPAPPRPAVEATATPSAPPPLPGPVALGERLARLDRGRGRSADHAPRVYLSASDDLEAAPTIGPKMAERFQSFGVRTVADFLATDADAAALQLGMRGVDGAVIELWKDQARLVMAVPGLRGTQAQLLAGAGYRTVADIASADADQLCAALLTFATTPEGHRILRDGNPPDVERVKAWIDGARQARAA